MPPKKRAAKKPRPEKVKSAPPARRSSTTWTQPHAPRSGYKKLVQYSGHSSYSHSQEAHLDHYAEFVNMPVGILVSVLVPAALCADWRWMTKDQRIMLLVLFMGTMVTAFLTFIFSEAFIEATVNSRSAASSSTFSTTVGAQRHSRTLHLFIYLSVMFVLFLICVQSLTLRKSVFPKVISSVATAGISFMLFPPTARHFNAWINSRPPDLHLLRHVAILIVLLGFILSLKKGSMREIQVAVSDSYEKFNEGLQKLKPDQIRKIMRR